jgi:hypothetical protein
MLTLHSNVDNCVCSTRPSVCAESLKGLSASVVEARGDGCQLDTSCLMSRAPAESEVRSGAWAPEVEDATAHHLADRQDPGRLAQSEPIHRHLRGKDSVARHHLHVYRVEIAPGVLRSRIDAAKLCSPSACSDPWRRGWGRIYKPGCWSRYRIGTPISRTWLIESLSRYLAGTLCFAAMQRRAG